MYIVILRIVKGLYIALYVGSWWVFTVPPLYLTSPSLPVLELPLLYYYYKRSTLWSIISTLLLNTLDPFFSISGKYIETFFLSGNIMEVKIV